jgi:hypothetical protein
VKTTSARTKNEGARVAIERSCWRRMAGEWRESCTVASVKEYGG